MQRLLFIKTLAVILISLLDGRVIEVSEKYLKNLGYTRNEVIGKTTVELNIWVDSQQRETLLRLLVSNGKVENFATELRMKNGQIIACRCFVEYGTFDEQQCIAGLIFENAEPMQVMSAGQGHTLYSAEQNGSETALTESKDLYHQVVKDAQIVIMSIDKTGRILFINEFGSSFFGYQPSELIGYFLQDTLLPEIESTGRNLWELHKSMSDNQETHKKFICECVKKDGRRVWIEWTNRFQKDGQARVVTVGVDITARRQAAALARAMDERRRREKMLDDVLENRITEEKFFNIAKETGFRIAPPLVCYILTFDLTEDRLKFLKENSQDWRTWVNTAIDLIYARLGNLAWHTEHGIAILRHSSIKSYTRSIYDNAAWIEKLSNVLKDIFRGIHFMVGISTTQTKIKAAYVQAYEAVRIGPVFHPDKYVHYWRDLGVNRLLVEQAKSTTGMIFIQDYLGPLLEKPSSRNEEWLLTLRELLSGDSMNAIAERLHIHPKTLAFRKTRIKRLLQLDVDDPEERLNIAVALKLKQLREKL